ncbi:MAG: hypothetical protein OK422_01265 [Thaumarchaeota archaeon]|nr:hypothetical protein [Nitrososphaerota archaeon]
MPLRDRRQEYSWPKSAMTDVNLSTEKKDYGRDEVVAANLEFRIVGGVREAFNPDVWTVAWEDFDKLHRLRIYASVGALRPAGITKTLGKVEKVVRKAKFYWSRDPDLPYRIWAMIIPEDGGPPKLPLNVEDAKSKMYDIVKRFEFPAGKLGPGTHKLVGTAEAKWGRLSYIEKGGVSGKSSLVVIKIE